jgi:perosamine synthetase
MKNGTSKFYAVGEPDLGPLEERYVLDAVRSGWVSSLGKYVDGFEAEFARYCGSRYGVSACNGTAALHLALLCLGIGPGDEVIVPTFTFVATANAVMYTGAAPVFADANATTWCVDAPAIERALSPRTRAIIVVHLFGHPADMDPIMELAAARDVLVIEDAAQAHGAIYKGRKAGSIGKIGAFSFYGNKLITTGEGGMLITDDVAIAERARFLRDHSMSKQKRYWHPEIGYNYRLTNVQAALGLAQLERIDELLARKRAIMGWYREFLHGCNDLMLNPAEPWALSSYWMVSALLPASLVPERVALKLRAAGIDTRPFFPPMHTLPFYRGCGDGGDATRCFPVAEDLAAHGLSLPSGSRLDCDDVRYIAEIVKQVLDEQLGGEKSEASEGFEQGAEQRRSG